MRSAADGCVNPKTIIKIQAGSNNHSSQAIKNNTQNRALAGHDGAGIGRVGDG